VLRTRRQEEPARGETPPVTSFAGEIRSEPTKVVGDYEPFEPTHSPGKKRDEDKTKQELIGELREMRQRIVMLEASPSPLPRVEEALIESEEWFNRLYHNALVGVFTTTVEGSQAIAVNDVGARMFGYSSEEEFLSEFTARKHYADPKQRAEVVKGLIEQGEIQNHQCKFIRKDGTPLWTEFYARVYPDKGWVQSISVDISGLKRIEEALRKSEERYRALVETAPEVIFTLSAEDGVITSLNSAFETVTGWSRDNWIGRHFTEFIHPDDVPTAVERFQQSLQGKPSPPFELRFGSKAGDTLTGEVVGTVYDEDGKGIELVGFARDISARREAEGALARYADELARSNAELQQFAYIASHDLQEPLRKVKSFTQLLAEHYGGQLDEKADKYINYIVDGASRMQTLITDLLTYSRVSTKGNPFEPTSCDDVLDRAIDNLEFSIKETSATIVRDPLPTVMADAVQLVQLFQNLIGNAIKFHGETVPRINISVQKQNAEWVFSVKDNGIGFDPQHAERIFVVFQRLHARDEYPGTGIGLAVCKRITERHGGRIWAESAPGQGSTFRFTLPTMAEQGGAQP